MRRNLVEVVVTKSVSAVSSASADSTITVLKTVTLNTETSSAPMASPTLITYYMSDTDMGSATVLGTGSSMPSQTSSSARSSSLSAQASSTAVLNTSASVSGIQGSSSGGQLGMAIGIPIAVVSFFGLCIFLLIFLRKKYGTNPTDLLALKAPSKKSKNSGIDLEKGMANKSVSSGDESFESSEKIESKEPPVERARPPKLSFVNRLSKYINVPETPMELKSAVFLRRFNLSKKDALEKELPDSPAPTVQVTDAKPSEQPKVHVVVRPYARRLQDELTVCAGEKVTVRKVHSDGWITVKRLDDGEVGVIPLLCVQRLGDSVIQS